MSEFNDQREDVFEDEYEEALDVGGTERNLLPDDGADMPKNKYDTKKNHIISIVCMLILAALLALLGLWESSRHEEFEPYLHVAISGADNMVQCYAVGREGQVEEIESFDGCTVEIWNGGTDMYEAVYEGNVKRIRLKNPRLYRDGEEAEITSDLMAVIQSAEEAGTSIRHVNVYRAEGEYFLSIEPKETLWKASSFYYYNADSGELELMFEFDEGEVIGFGMSEEFRKDKGMGE